MPVKTQERYRSTIAAYEKRRYGRLVTAKVRRRKFDSREQAEEWARSQQMDDVVADYGEIYELPNGQWEMSVLR